MFYSDSEDKFLKSFKDIFNSTSVNSEFCFLFFNT